MSYIYSTRGLVSSRSPQAVSAGLGVLADGGNAFDAALAVVAVEAVTLPAMCGLGGDLFAILYDASTDKVVGINGSGGAPTGATTQFFRSRGYSLMPLNGPLSISVPGEVDAWAAIHKGFCTRPLQQLLEPAVRYGEEGFPIQLDLANVFRSGLEKLNGYPATAEVLTKHGQPYGAGDVLVQRDLARSLRRVAGGGADEFYRGGLAGEMVAALQRAGAPFTEDDFARHRTEVYHPPLSTDYRGYTVYTQRPPSQGLLLLEILNILEGFDLASLGHDSAQAVHLMVEAKKLAFADRNRYAGDPEMVSWPLETTLAKDHAARLRKSIDPSKAAAEPRAATPVGSDGNTSYFCVADKQGNCVSLIHSLSKGFGSDFIAPGTGILFNNRAGRGFTLQEGHPNAVAPGKRTMHTLHSYMVFKDGKPLLIGGTPGGDSQPQTNVQVLTAMLDFGLNLRAAMEAPRWTSFPGTDPETLERPFEIQVEPGMPVETRRGLTAMGHEVTMARSVGIVQLIRLDHERGTLEGASDPRSGGYAGGI